MGQFGDVSIWGCGDGSICPPPNPLRRRERRVGESFVENLNYLLKF